MTSEPDSKALVNKPASAGSSANPWRTFGIIIITALITLGIAYWLYSAYLFPTAFTPVVLDETEQQQLEQKLQRIGGVTPGDQTLEPEPYTETDASRIIHFSEKELNALLANNTDLASELAIDLSENLVSAKILLPLDPDLPVLGGKKLRVTAGIALRKSDGQLSAILKGISVWGVPLPNSLLGNLKNIDLVKEFAGSGGFWQAISDGVEDIEVQQGELRIKLKQ